MQAGDLSTNDIIERWGPIPRRRHPALRHRHLQYYALGEIEQALADSKPGEVIKPILRMPH